MKYIDFKRNVIMEIGEWSANGALTSELSNKDYMLSMTDFTNRELTQVVTVTKSKKLDTFITQRNPKNGLGSLWEIYEFKGEDITFDLSKGRAYSFHIGGSGTVYVEEEIASVWTVKDTIIHTHINGQGDVLYKGNIDKVDNLNPVRLRFSGTYNYWFKWVALFTDYLEFPVSYEPRVEHSLPTNLYLLETVSVLKDKGEYIEYPSKEYEQAGKKLLLPYESEGEFKIKYSAYPDLLTYDIDDLTISDDVELDIVDEYLPSLINGVAGKLKANIDKKYSVGDRYAAIAIDSTNATLSNKQRKAVESPIRGSR